MTVSQSPTQPAVQCHYVPVVSHWGGSSGRPSALALSSSSSSSTTTGVTANTRTLVSGKLWLTNYRVIFRLDNPIMVSTTLFLSFSSKLIFPQQPGASKFTNIVILLGSIFAFSLPSSTDVELLAKPWKRFLFKFSDAKVAKEIHSFFKTYVPPDLPLKKALLTTYCPEVRPCENYPSYLPEYEPSGIKFGHYFPPRDFARMGVEKKYKLGSLCSDTYPPLYYIPRSATDDFVNISMGQREKGEFPILIFVKVYLSSLCSDRCRERYKCLFLGDSRRRKQIKR